MARHQLVEVTRRAVLRPLRSSRGSKTRKHKKKNRFMTTDHVYENIRYTEKGAR
jgi:hypothetical protein